METIWELGCSLVSSEAFITGSQSAVTISICFCGWYCTESLLERRQCQASCCSFQLYTSIISPTFFTSNFMFDFSYVLTFSIEMAIIPCQEPAITLVTKTYEALAWGQLAVTPEVTFSHTRWAGSTEIFLKCSGSACPAVCTVWGCCPPNCAKPNQISVWLWDHFAGINICSLLVSLKSFYVCVS